MTNSNITGRLINARRRPVSGGYTLIGECYEDVHGRFDDGQIIETSKVKWEDGSIVGTVNSIYEVESWAK